MRLPAFLAGIAVALLFVVSGGTPASAQTKTTTKSQTKTVNVVNRNNSKVNEAAKVVSKTVTVNSGDSLSSIAAANQTTYIRLYEANTSITNPDLIFPGDQLRIPAPDEQLPERALPTPAPAVAPAAPVAQPAAVAAAPQPQATYTAPAAPTPTPVAPATPVSGCGDNQYANYIYMHESGCNTSATSPNGCYGIGQACPASKIGYCGTDYSCQNAYFTAYANKYGGWQGAYDFWTSHGWW